MKIKKIKQSNQLLLYRHDYKNFNSTFTKLKQNHINI